MTIELDELAGPDGGKEGRRLAKLWSDQINSVKDNSAHKRWVRRGESIEKRYRDERSRTDEEGQRRYNALWSNVEVLKPALYGKMPLPIAERKFKDKDPVGRSAATMLERGLRNEIEINGFNEAIKQAVMDYLLPGRGTVWVRYEPEIEDGISLPVDQQIDMKDDEGRLDSQETIIEEEQAEEVITPKGRIKPRLLPEGAEEGDEEEEATEKLQSTNDRIIRESVPVDFIAWPDFFTFPVRARTWAEVTAIGKRVYMSRDQMTERFGDKIGKAIPLERDNRGDRTQNSTMQSHDDDKGIVYEIWNKDDRTVYWVAQGYDYLCDRKDDPLTLENFFPVPPPLYANPTTNTLIPVPDFIQYQDQAIQIDELTQRIAMLSKACKVAGLYNAAAKDVQRLLNESVENELIPVDDWAAFAERGGVEGNISLLPLQVIKDVIQQLMGVKQQQIEEMDRLTGINDIMRGTSDARETMGGVRIKSNNTGSRLKSRQDEVARLCRDVVKIMADIMSQHFSPKSLIEVSGALYAEGLGPDDMPPLSELRALPQPVPGLPAQAAPKPPTMTPGMPPSVPPPAGTMPQAAPGAAAGAPPAPGGNVIPFKPQNQPAPAPMGAMPAPPLTGDVLPPLPPELMRKLEAIQRIAQAISLLRDERLRGFRVDIEVDSTIYGDAEQEKQSRNEFTQTVTGYLEKATMLGAQLPEAIPLLGKLLQFAVRGFRVGRDIEVAIEEFVDEAMEKAKQRIAQQATQPNPEAQKNQIDLMKAQSAAKAQEARTQVDMVRAHVDMESAKLEATTEQQQAAAEIERQRVENEGEQANARAEMAMKAAELRIKEAELRIREKELAVEELTAQLELEKLRNPPPIEARPAPKAV